MREIIFINKTSFSKNIARSTPAERRLINEQNRSHRSVNRRDRSSHASDLENLEQDTSVQSNDNGLPSNTEFDVAQKLIDVQSVYLQGVSRAVGSPHDPFETASIPLNDEVVKLLRYYKEAYYVYLWTSISSALEERLGPVDIPRSTPERVILECMEDRTRMYALLANVACYLEHNVERGNAIDGLRMTQRGIAALHEDMQASDGTVKVETLVAAIHLYMASKSSHQMQAAQAHLLGAKALLQKLIEQKTAFKVAQMGLCALVDVELATQLLRNVSSRGLRKEPISVQIVLGSQMVSIY